MTPPLQTFLRINATASKETLETPLFLLLLSLFYLLDTSQSTHRLKQLPLIHKLNKSNDMVSLVKSLSSSSPNKSCIDRSPLFDRLATTSLPYLPSSSPGSSTSLTLSANLRLPVPFRNDSSLTIIRDSIELSPCSSSQTPKGQRPAFRTAPTFHAYRIFETCLELRTSFGLFASSRL